MKDSKDLYLQFHKQIVSDNDARYFLKEMLECASLDKEILSVSSIDELYHFLHNRHLDILQKYESYVQDRKQHLQNAILSNPIYAKLYLVHIAPTKMVDGVWLRSVAELPDSQYKSCLLRIYLDECGQYNYTPSDPNDEHNHIQIYRRLLNEIFPDTPVTNNVHDWVDHQFLHSRKFDLFQPGCIQMAFGQMTNDFLPELIGYNLGYEQISLDMLKISHDLQEFGIDSKYFDIHATVDNFHCGHAQQAFHAARIFLQRSTNFSHDMTRVINGYMLSEMLPSASDIIDSFDISKFVENMMEKKARLSYSLHSNILVQSPDSNNDIIHLSDMMKNSSGSMLLHYLKYNNYFTAAENGDFGTCKFNHVLKNKMLGVFTNDELSLLKQWWLKVTFNEVTEDTIYEIIGKNIHKHARINMQHPNTNEVATMAHWYQRSKSDFMLCVSTPGMKKRTYNSLQNGKMKNINFTPYERKVITAWCKSE